MEEKRLIKRKEKARTDGNREQLAISCNNLGDFYNQNGNYESAVKEYLEEANLYAKLGKKLEMAKAHRMIGEMFMLICDFDKARKHINIYLKTVRFLQNKVEEQRAYATLGRAHLLHGQSTSETSASITLEQLKLAEKAFLKSLLLIKEITGQITKLEQLDMQARCYLNIGVVKEHMEEFEESIAYIDRAIKICKAHDLFELTHLCYISMSLLYHCKKNDTTLALRFCNLALETAKRLPNKVQKICETLITKAEILIKSGDFASSKQILTKAYKKNTPNVNDRETIEKMLRIVVKICRTLDDLVIINSTDYAKCKELYEILGDGCCHLQNYDKALEYYRKMLECAENNGEEGKALAPIFVSLYQTYKDNKEYNKALEYLWKEYEINKDVPSEAATTLCAIAEICETENQCFWRIQEVYEKARAHIEKIEDITARKKLEKIVFIRLKKLQVRHKMNALAEILQEEATSRGIDLNNCKDDESDDDEVDAIEHNTPELGDDVCLDDLTDSDTSDLDETEKPRPHRATRGTRCLAIKRNNKGETQLHQACIAGNLELVRRLLDQGHAVNVRDHAGWLPLHEACNHGFRDIVELLLERGATAAINDKGGTSCDGITPLYDACVNGYLDVVELLMERGADATVKTDFGEICINGLDKWRRTATLTTGEQAHYHQVRTTILRPLAKAGIVGNSKLTLSLKNTAADAIVKTENKSMDLALLSDNDNDNDVDNTEDDNDDEKDDDGYDANYLNAHILKDANKTSTTAAASVEYRNVMEQLKHPNRKVDDDMYGPSSSGNNCTKQKRNALLKSEETDDNNWLIDDVGPEKKKRRYVTPTRDIHRTTSNTSLERMSTSKENLYDTNFQNSLDSIESNSDGNAFQILQEASNSAFLTQNRKKRSSLSLVKQNKLKQQTSLLESGFCRFRSESPNSFVDESNFGINVPTGPEPDSTTATSIHLVISPAKTASPIQVHASQLLTTTISFKIKIEDELLLVPIERKKLNDINIRWLAEEAARRYYNLTGLKPVLRLKTNDGFAFEENDPLNVAVEQSMIQTTVLEWKIAPLGQRYEEMCHQLKKDMKSEVKRSLEFAQSSNCLQFENFWLTAQATEPIFRALMHQTQLRVLNLAHNFLQNEGCFQLAKAIATLTHLKTLNLKGNFITSNGLEVILLNQNDENISKLKVLEELNISQNPLGNDCFRILEKFYNKNSFETGKSLDKLWLSQCGITNVHDYDLKYFELTTFDISFNQLDNVSRQKLLKKLNSCRLQCLNLNYTRIDNEFDEFNDIDGDSIVKFFESGTCEKIRQVELNGCNLSDAHIYHIVQCLKNANALELLDITDNEKLTGSSLQYILSEIPQLRKLLATNCQRFIDNERLQKLALIKQLPNFMCLTLNDVDLATEANNDSGRGSGNIEKEHETCEANDKLCQLWKTHWGDKAKVISYGSNLVLYTNDKDLL